MPSRILLISANRCTTPDAVFPLGLAYLNGALRRAGHETAWVDCLVNPADLEPILKSWQPDAAGISLRNIDDVLIRKQETFFGELTSLTTRIRQARRCPVILGGSGFSMYPERLLELAGADFGICGEGEAGLPALLSCLQRGGGWETVPGLVFRNGNGIVVNPVAAQAFEGGVDLADRPASIAGHYLQATGVLNVQTQRGCAFHCCYCTYPLIEGRQHRSRPPEQVAAEFEQLEKLGARYVFVVDSVFNSSARHVTAICEAILARNVKLAWGCFLRPQGLSAELIRLMKRAGLAHIEFGSDSFCDEVLAAYGKDFTFADICRASELAREQEIDFCHYLISGGPGETATTIEAGFANSRRLTGAIIMAVVGMRVYPGTPLLERARREGVIRSDADLLGPAYYIAPGLTSDGAFERLQAFARQSPNWIVGDPTPAYARLVERLRQRGIIGPLWSYLAMLQRLWPQGIPSEAPAPRRLSSATRGPAAPA